MGPYLGTATRIHTLSGVDVDPPDGCNQECFGGKSFPPRVDPLGSLQKEYLSLRSNGPLPPADSFSSSSYSSSYIQERVSLGRVVKMVVDVDPAGYEWIKTRMAQVRRGERGSGRGASIAHLISHPRIVCQSCPTWP